MQNTFRRLSDPLDGPVVSNCLGTPGQTKVCGDCQRETSHDICCLAAELSHIIEVAWADAIHFVGEEFSENFVAAINLSVWQETWILNLRNNNIAV